MDRENMIMEDSFRNSKMQALKAAKELHYPPEVWKKIEKCENMNQLSIVMTTARQRFFK